MPMVLKVETKSQFYGARVKPLMATPAFHTRTGQVPVALLQIHSPASVSRKEDNEGPMTQLPATHHMGDLNGSWFWPDPALDLQDFEENTPMVGKLSFSLSFSFSHSFSFTLPFK